MRRILLSLFAMCVCAITQAQTTIASDGFENSLTLFTATTGTASYSTGTSSATLDRVASSPFASVGSFALRANNTTLGITSSAINTVGYSGVSLSLKLASWSFGTTTNGADGTDIVTIEVSPDNGTTYYSTERVLGNTNAYWSYTTGTATASTAYDGNTTPVDFTPAAGGARTTDGYSTMTITGLPAVSQLRVRITMVNNAANELWTIDDFRVQGTLGSFRTITFTGASSDFNSAERFTAAANNTDYYMAFDATYLYLGAFRTSGTFGTDDNFAVYIDADPRNTPASGNGTTAGRAFNSVTPTLPFNADFTSYTTQTYTDPIHRFNGSWATIGVTPSTNTNTTCREVRIALSDLGNPASVYVTMWMGYNGGIFSNAPGTNVSASGTPTIAGYFGSFPIYKAGINPMTYRTQNTTAANGGGTAISNLTLTASGNIADDYGDITISNAAVGTVSIANASFTGSLTLNNTSTVALGTNRLNVGGRGVGGTAGRVVMDNTSTTSIDGTSTVGTVNFLGLGQVSGSNSARTFGTNSTVALSGGVDFTSSATNVNGVLQLNAGGYVNTNPPSYGSASTLIYNSGGTYTASLEWTPNAATGVGVPNNVTVGGGVNTIVSFGSSSQYRRARGAVTIASGSTLALSSVSGGDLQMGGTFSAVGTITANGRAVTMNGTVSQGFSGLAMSLPYFIIDNPAGVNLGTPFLTIASPGSLTFVNGKISLNGNNLTIQNGASIVGANSSNYVQTNGSGRLVQTVGTSNVTYPIGNSTYNPLTFSNSGTSDTHQVRVIDAALVGTNDVTYTINRRWEIFEGTTGGSVITPALTYNSGEENNSTNWAAGTQNYVGLYNGSSWTQVAATQTGSGPYTVTAGASLSPAAVTYFLGLGRDAGLGAAPPTITGISVAAPGSGTSGYVGTTITVTGTNLSAVTIVRVGGSGGTAVTIASQTSTTITFAAINLGGQIYVENGAGNATSAASYTNLGYITQAAGVYTTAGTWLGGAVPVASANITIAHAVTLASAVANSVNLFTINSGATFTMNTGVAAIAITTLLNNGTWASSAAGTTTIAAGGTITNNGTVTVTFGNMVFAGSGTVNGTNAWTFTNVTINGGLTLTTIPNIQGSLTLNTGGFVTAAPTYISNGSLVYNTGGTFAMSNEWTGNGTAVGTGIPMNVTIQNTTTVTFPTTNRGCAGTFTITTGGATLNGTSGDLYVAGNFVQNGTFTTSGRAVFFNGSAAQAVSGSGTISFDYLIINNSHASGVTINKSASVIATTGNVLQLLGTGPLNIGTANVVLTVSGNGGNILVNGGVRVINTVLATNALAITGTKTVTSVGGGTLNFTAAVAAGSLSISAGVNFGSALTTIGNNAYLTILAGGFVDTNPVTYATGSTLSFNTGASYGVGSTDRTWAPGTSGAGVPFNVLVNAAGTDVVINDNRSITNNLTITAGTLTNNTNTLDIGPSGGGNKVLAVNGGTLTNNGGTLNHNGNVLMTAGAFNMSGGTFMVDGNDGTSGTSVASGLDLFTINSAVVNTGVTGGTLLINDPPFTGTGRVFTFTGSTSNRIWTGHTLQLGGSTGTHTSTATNGFNVDTYVGTVNLRLGNVIVNGGSGASRFASAPATSTNAFDVSGDLTINANSELRTLNPGTAGPDIRVSGNVINNGTLTIVTGTALSFSTRIGSTISANTVAQVVSGSGTFRNSTGTSTASFSELIINNTAGVTFSVGQVSVNETVTFTAGILDVGTANDFVLVGTATQTRTSGYLLRDATAAGFMKRTHTGIGSYTYMIGNGGVYSPITLNFSTNSVSRQMGVSVVDATHPDMNYLATAVDYLSRYWRLFESGAGGSYAFTTALTYDVAGDVNGTASSMRVSGWDGSAWTEYGVGSVASPVITSAAINQTNAPTLNNLVVTGRRNPTTVYTWTGGSSNTTWADAGNWSPSGIPAAADAVIINTAPGFNVNITDARTVTNLTLNGTGVLNIASTGSLTVTGAVTYATSATANLDCASTVTFSSTSALSIPQWSYGHLNIGGGARTWASAATTSICGNLTTGGAAQTATGSTVVFNGTGAQSITGNASFATLNITNTGGAITPASGTTVTVATGLNVSASALFNIGTGATLTLSGGSSSLINGTLRRTGTLTSSGTVVVGSTGVYDHNSNSATLMVATWNTGSTCMVTGFSSGTSMAAGSQAFHHFIYNCPSQTSGVQCSGSLTTINGDFTVLSTGTTGQLILSNSAYTLNVAGNLNVTPTTGQRGYLNLSGGGIGTVNLSGNLDMNSTGSPEGLITESGSGSGRINFVKPGLISAYAVQTMSQSGSAVFTNDVQLVVGATSPSYSTLRLLTNITTTSSVTVSNGGALDFQGFLVSGPNLTGNSGGKLITTNSDGFVATGAQGSIRSVVRSLNGAMRFEYNGSSAQNTGNGVPATAAELVINNTSGVTLSSPLTIQSGNLTLSAGNLKLGNNDLTLASGSTPVGQSASSFVVTDGTGDFGYEITTTPTTYLYPLGDETGTAEYSPASFDFVSNSTTRTLYLSLIDATHPNNAPAAEYLSRYWSTRVSSNAGTYSYLPSFTYLAGDVVGSVSNMHSNTWNTFHWSEPNTSSTVASNVISYGTALTETTNSLGASLDWTARNGRCTGTPDAGNILSSSAGPFCDAANTTLYLGNTTLNNGFTYQWQTSFSGAANTYSNIIGGTNPTQLAASSLTQYYRVQVVCSYSSLTDSTANFQVVVNQSPTITVTPSSGMVCGTTGVVLNASGATTYAWSPPTGLNIAVGNTVTATPSANTTYTVLGTDGFGCIGSAQASITYSPAVPTFTIGATPNPICAGNDVTLAATVGASGINTTVLSQNFNGANDWTTTNASTGGTVDSAAWILRPNGYVYNSNTFSSNDASACYITNSDLQGAGTTSTTLRSPAFSTVGLTSCAVNFFHYYQFNSGTESAKVEVSTNGTTWTTLQTYTSNQGSATTFASASVSLNAYINNPTVYVRFKYDATFDWYWAVDNVTITGNTPYTYAWTSTEGFSSSATSPSTTVFDSATFSLTLTNSNGCTGSANTSLTVAPAPEVNAGTDLTTCVGVGIAVSTASQLNTASIAWTHSGAGTLTNATTLTPTYTPVAGDAGQNIILTLTGTGTSPCTNVLDQMSIAVTNLIQYYVDADGDGFGTGASAGSGCTVPSGFAANNTDICDTNSELNPNTEWWIDEDGDGVGSYIYGNGNAFGNTCAMPTLPSPATAVPYDPNQHGGTLYGVDCDDTNDEIVHGGPFYVDMDMDGFGDVNDVTPLYIPGTCAVPTYMSFNNDDCDDSNPNISPLASEVCNGIDDNCDGLTDNACVLGYTNDAPTGAISISGTAIFPTCNPTVGTNSYATVSSQSTSTTAVGGGRDVWYSFTAAGPTYQIRVYNAVGFDPLIELRTGAASTLPTLVSTQNALTTNTETMVISGLTTGVTYFVAVRCYDNSVGGTFNLCVARITNSNDEIAGAVSVSATSGYSICSLVSGTNLYATVSATATSTTASGGGRDVWYKFTATTPSIHLKVMNAVGFDPIIELRTGVNGVTHVDTENISTGPNEIMNYQGLTVGNEYYFAVRCYDNSLGGTFSYCLTNFIASGCLASQASTISNCSTFKFKFTYASSYVVTFAPTMGSVGGGSITTTGSFAAGSTLVNLIPGNSYTVQVDATYQVANANGGIETIVVMGTPSCTVTIAAHSSIEVRANQRCSFPATLLRSTYLRSEPFVCGVTSYTFEFTPVVSCSNNTSTGVSFTINNPSRIIQLNFSGSNTTPSGQTITGMTYYRVRVRPSFGPGSVPGTWGTDHIIYVAGTSSEEMDVIEDELLHEDLAEIEAEAILYPNPNQGDLAILSHGQLEMPTTLIEIFDGRGKLVFTRLYNNEGSNQTIIEFEEQLPSGIYLVNMINGNREERLRMVVTK